MFILNDKPLGLDNAFVHNEISYPANWLRLASPEERAAIGVTEVDDPAVYDDRFYWGPQNPKDLSNLISQWSSEISSTVWKLLNPTDFMDSRKANDPRYEAPAEWLAWRESIRNTAKTAKAALANCTTVEELIPLVNPQWPTDPSQQGGV